MASSKMITPRMVAIKGASPKEVRLDWNGLWAILDLSQTNPRHERLRPVRLSRPQASFLRYESRATSHRGKSIYSMVRARRSAKPCFDGKGRLKILEYAKRYSRHLENASKNSNPKSSNRSKPKWLKIVSFGSRVLHQ